MQSHPSHTPDLLLILYSFGVALWAHALSDPWGTIAVVIAIMGGTVRLAINVREWVRDRE